MLALVSPACTFTVKPASDAIDWMISPICLSNGVFSTRSSTVGCSAPASRSSAFARATSRGGTVGLSVQK